MHHRSPAQQTHRYLAHHILHIVLLALLAVIPGDGQESEDRDIVKPGTDVQTYKHTIMHVDTPDLFHAFWLTRF